MSPTQVAVSIVMLSSAASAFAGFGSLIAGAFDSKFDGVVTIEPKLAEFIRVENCEDKTPTINCTVRNLTGTKINDYSARAEIRFKCYNGDNVEVAGNRAGPLDPKGAVRSITCPSNNGVKKIVYYLHSK